MTEATVLLVNINCFKMYFKQPSVFLLTRELRMTDITVMEDLHSTVYDGYIRLVIYATNYITKRQANQRYTHERLSAMHSQRSFWPYCPFANV